MIYPGITGREVCQYIYGRESTQKIGMISVFRRMKIIRISACPEFYHLFQNKLDRPQWISIFK
ncbi:MAG: hypothetical protein CVV44_10915 [Spirochaetae bacterium HGW-Spirochaetae-1]|nr:MAG: hypothetical protein CVV44_10915 [Spirochaetae bacterium HGW-Spirochaetae-1]